MYSITTLTTFIYKKVRNFIAPPFCVQCRCWLDEPAILCDVCRALIQPVVSTRLAVTASLSMSVIAVSPYQDPLKSLILAKSSSQRLASYQLGELLWKMTAINSLNFDYIIPIPLHWTRYASRGYNQAEVMASVIACKSGKLLVHGLKRNRRTLFQSKLTHEERAENLSNAFDLAIKHEDYSLYRGKHLLLVDDLMTTGSTLKNAAKKLLGLKPAKITVIVACRTV